MTCRSRSLSAHPPQFAIDVHKSNSRLFKRVLSIIHVFFICLFVNKLKSTATTPLRCSKTVFLIAKIGVQQYTNQSTAVLFMFSQYPFVDGNGLAIYSNSDFQLI